jgi:hypothetical protein
MSHRKLGLGTLGLCLVMMASLLCFCAAAQAEGNFWVERELASAFAATVEVESEEDKAFTLVPKGGSTISCEKVKLENGLLLLAGSSSGSLLFEKCSNGSECTVGNISVSLKGSLFLHGVSTYDSVESSTTVIKLTECKTPEEKKLLTIFVLEDANGEFEIDAVSHLVQVAPEALFKTLTEKSELKLAGSIRLKLKGANTGRKWRASFEPLKGEFKVKGAKLGATEEIGWKEDKAFTLLWNSFNLEIPCGVFAVDDGLAFTDGTSSGTLLLKKCKAFSMAPKLEELASCTVADISAKFKGALMLQSGKTYELIEPYEGLTFTKLMFSGAGCVLPKEADVRGAIVLEGKFDSEAEEHLVQVAPEASFPFYSLKVGVNKLFLDGSASLRLTGKESGKAWSAVAL